MPTAEREELRQISQSFEGHRPQDILRWALATYPRLCMATAFGAEGCALIHMLADLHRETGKAPYLFNLETGYQFQETLETRNRLQERYGLTIHLVQAEQSVEAMEREHGGPIYPHRPDLCCHIRKTVPLRRVTAQHDAWISAIRRDQTAVRAHAGIVEWDPKFGLVKVNPLANWTKKDVWSFIVKHEVPYNPLYDQGYASIGCWPCTRPVLPDQNERDGRWSGSTKIECGIHTQG